MIDTIKRTYHLRVAAGEVNPFVLLCGNPERAKASLSFLHPVTFNMHHREFVVVTGYYQGTPPASANVPVTIIGTGIGADNTEIALVELRDLLSEAFILRVGTCGALEERIHAGDFIVSTGALRLESVSTSYVPEGYPASPHFEIVPAILESCSRNRVVSHVGLTATAPGFYASQGREKPFYPPPSLNGKALKQYGVLGMEMEASAVFILSRLFGFQAGALCAVVAERSTETFMDREKMDEAERKLLKIGLDTLACLHKMQEVKRENKVKHWLPTLSLPPK